METPAMVIPQVFTHEQFGDIRIRVYGNNEIEINLEDSARGLGFVDVHFAKSGERWESVRWERVRGYLEDLGYEGEVSKDAYIPEHIFYRLAMKAKNAAADKFQKWIAEEVIPKIRTQGFYMTPDFKVTPDFLRQIADTIEAKDKKISAQADVIAMQDAKIAELTPKASYYDVILNCKDLVATTTIAKDYGMSATKFNQLLHEYGVQFKQSGVWYLYQNYAALGWMQTRTFNYPDNGEIHAKVHSYWTQTGRRGLYELLKAKGHLPLIEQPAPKGKEIVLWF